MNKIGILAFYIDIGNLAPEDIDDHVERCMKVVDPVDKEDETISLNHWDRLFIPVRDSNSRIQVIRNDGQELDEIQLSELREKLKKVEELLEEPTRSFIFSQNSEIVGQRNFHRDGSFSNQIIPEPMSDLEQDWLEISKQNNGRN